MVTVDMVEGIGSEGRNDGAGSGDSDGDVVAAVVVIIICCTSRLKVAHSCLHGIMVRKSSEVLFIK